jgi:phage protein D
MELEIIVLSKIRQTHMGKPDLKHDMNVKVGLFGRGTSGRMEGERSKELVNMMEAFYI